MRCFNAGENSDGHPYGATVSTTAFTRSNIAVRISTSLKKAGGNGEFLEFAVPGEIGHRLVGYPRLWSGDVENYLIAIGAGTIEYGSPSDREKGQLWAMGQHCCERKRMTAVGRGRVKRQSPTITEQFTVAPRATAWRIFRILHSKSNRIACFRKDGDFSHGLGREPPLQTGYQA